MSNDIQFVEVDAEKIQNDLITDFESTSGDTLYPGDERSMFLSNETPVIVGLKNDINDTGRQNLLRYSRGTVLDAWGERVNTPRLDAQKAYTTLRFTLSATRTEDTLIAAGKRASPDGVLYFATNADLTIPAGQLTGDVRAGSTYTGAMYNGFAPGQIKNLTDPIPYVANVQNIDTSSDGADIEPDDDGTNTWSGYRERIRQAPCGYSTAGTENGYVYWAKTADANIQDVGILFPSPGHVQIVVLMIGGQMPTQATLEAVNNACNDRSRRPLTDFMTVSAPGTVNYDINLTYYISIDRKTEETSIRNAIEGYVNSQQNKIPGAVDQYKVWQQVKLGRAINPDNLRQLMLAAGAYRIDMASPIFTVVDADKVAYTGATTVNYGGLI